MHITFEISSFAGKAKELTNTLYFLKRQGVYFNHHDPEIEAITCRTPSSAYRYARYVATSGISAEAEKVFNRNANVGIKYLTFTRKKEFSDVKNHQRFWKKVLKDPHLAYTWANSFKTRLPREEDEMIFIENMKQARDYAFFVIKGKFPEKIHNMLVLKSFENMDRWQKNWLQEYINYAAKNES